MQFSTLKTPFGACLLLVSTTIFSASTCQQPDPSFSHFLEKFIENSAFRLERTIQPLAFQGTMPDGRQANELTASDFKSPSIAQLLLPLSDRQLELEDAKNDEKWAIESTILFAKGSVTLMQGSYEADVWSRTYRFQRNDGCWRLVGLHVGGL